MQYRKHNFIHNFPTEAALDQAEAWQIIVAEINDIVLDPASRQSAISGLNASGQNIPEMISSSDLASAILDSIYKPRGSQSLVSLILDRHADPYVDSVSGPYDQGVPGAETNPAMALDALIAEKEPELTQGQIKQLLLKDLANKQTMRNIPIPFMERVKSASPMKIAVVLIGTGLLVYGIYKLLK